MNNGNNVLNKTILSEIIIEIFSKNHLFNLYFSKNILIYLVVSQIRFNFEAVFIKFAVAYNIMSGDSLLKMFLVLQYLRRLDALALHYCRWDCIGKGAKSEVMRATIYGKRLSCAL